MTTAHGLDASASLDRALDVVRAAAPSILRVGERLLLERDLRFALQDGHGLRSPIETLLRDDLLAADRAGAEALLAADPALPAVAYSGTDGWQGLCRQAPTVRRAVVMAGGEGRRLRPLTASTPKPMLEIAGRPLLFRILDQLAAQGVRQVSISVRYLADVIESAVGDGSAFGLEVDYLHEDEPLDTGAGLVQMQEATEPFYLINGDILTEMSFPAFAVQHHLSGNLATVATYLYPAPLPYGVVHGDGERLVGIEEKPVFRYPINAGIYLFGPRILDFVPAGGAPLAMVDFLNDLVARGERIGRFGLVEYWNDVGSHADFERAQDEVEAR